MNKKFKFYLFQLIFWQKHDIFRKLKKTTNRGKYLKLKQKTRNSSKKLKVRRIFPHLRYQVMLQKKPDIEEPDIQICIQICPEMLKIFEYPTAIVYRKKS